MVSMQRERLDSVRQGWRGAGKVAAGRSFAGAARACVWRPRGSAGAMTTSRNDNISNEAVASGTEAEGGYFALSAPVLSAAVFLHSERNFLRSLP